MKNTRMLLPTMLIAFLSGALAQAKQSSITLNFNQLSLTSHENGPALIDLQKEIAKQSPANLTGLNLSSVQVTGSSSYLGATMALLVANDAQDSQTIESTTSTSVSLSNALTQTPGNWILGIRGQLNLEKLQITLDDGAANTKPDATAKTDTATAAQSPAALPVPKKPLSELPPPPPPAVVLAPPTSMTPAIPQLPTPPPINTAGAFQTGERIMYNKYGVFVPAYYIRPAGEMGHRISIAQDMIDWFDVDNDSIFHTQGCTNRICVGSYYRFGADPTSFYVVGYSTTEFAITEATNHAESTFFLYRRSHSLKIADAAPMTSLTEYQANKANSDSTVATPAALLPASNFQPNEKVIFKVGTGYQSGYYNHINPNGTHNIRVAGGDDTVDLASDQISKTKGCSNGFCVGLFYRLHYTRTNYFIVGYNAKEIIMAPSDMYYLEDKELYKNAVGETIPDMIRFKQAADLAKANADQEAAKLKSVKVPQKNPKANPTVLAPPIIPSVSSPGSGNSKGRYQWDIYGSCGLYDSQGNFIQAGTLNQCRKASKSHYDWDLYGSCGEYTVKGTFIQAATVNQCRKAKGSRKRRDPYGSCSEYTPSGTFIQALPDNSCRR